MNIYEEITNKIIAAIEQGAGNFEMPWHRLAGNPRNASTGAMYRGINILGLEISRLERRQNSPYWASFKQWQELGAKVRKGEKGAVVVFYKPLLVDDKEAAAAAQEGEAVEVSETGQKRIFFLRHSHVFNADQVEGWSSPAGSEGVLEDKTALLAAADAFIGSTGADIREGGSRAFYSPADDFIGIPPRSSFMDTAHRSATEGYYGTLLHELVHWTGAESRCHRSLKGRFGSASYAEEELVAELGSAFLCSHLGVSVEVRQDHAQYLESWLQALKKDHRAIFRASSQAAKAVEYLEGLQGNLVREGVLDQTPALLQGLALDQSRE